VPEVYHADILLNLIEDLHRHTDDTVRIGNVASYDQAMREVLSSLGRRATEMVGNDIFHIGRCLVKFPNL